MLHLIAAAVLMNLPACEADRAKAAPALQEYRLDPTHSLAEFSIGFAFSHVKGRVRIENGTILYDPGTPARSSVSVVLDSKSINTGWGNRDRHLRTSDFFDVDKYPTITFRSVQLSPAPAGWVAHGDLTMHGVTKRIAIPFRLTQSPTRASLSGQMVLNAVGSVRLSRIDFGIPGGSTFNSWFDKARAATMTDSVDVELELEGYLADAASVRSQQIESMLQEVSRTGVQSQIALFDSLKKVLPAPEFESYLTGGDRLARGLVATCKLSEAKALSQALTRLFPTSHRARVIHGFVLAVAGERAAADREYAEARGCCPCREPTDRPRTRRRTASRPRWRRAPLRGVAAS